MSIIQFLVDEGVFVEDPDGLLWLSDEMKELVAKLERNDELLDLLDRIDDPEERALKRWSILYLNFIGASNEIKRFLDLDARVMRAVEALATWGMAAIDQDLTEWSMKLRIIR